MIFSEYQIHVRDNQIELWCGYCQAPFDPLVQVEPTLNDLVTSCNKHAHHAHVRENTWV